MNKALNASSIRAIAHAVRSKLGIENQPEPDFRNLLERFSQVFPETEVEVVSAEKTPALAWTESKKLYVQKSVMEELARGDIRARFTIAHEMAHIFLNHPTYRGFSKGRSETRDWQRQELEAALFANELLMPSFLTKRIQTAFEIHSTFQASHHTASNRIAELVSGDKMPLAPATRARTDLVNDLIKLGYSEGEISNLVVPKRTLARRRAEHELLTIEETDKALRLIRIARQAIRVFGDAAKAHNWLRKPKRELNSEIPVAFLASEEGARKVEEMLNRIDYGIFA